MGKNINSKGSNNKENTRKRRNSNNSNCNEIQIHKYESDDNISLVIYPNWTHVWVTPMKDPVHNLPILITSDNCKIDGLNRRYYKIPASKNEQFLIEIFSTDTVEITGVSFEGEIRSIYDPKYLYGRINQELFSEDNRKEFTSYFIEMDTTHSISVNTQLSKRQKPIDQHIVDQYVRVDGGSPDKITGEPSSESSYIQKQDEETKTVVFRSNSMAGVSLNGNNVFYIHDKDTAEVIIKPILFADLTVVIAINLYDELKSVEIDGLTLDESTYCKSFEQVEYDYLVENYFTNDMAVISGIHKYDMKLYMMKLDLRGRGLINSKNRFDIAIDISNSDKKVLHYITNNDPKLNMITLHRNVSGNYTSIKKLTGLSDILSTKVDSEVMIECDKDYVNDHPLIIDVYINKYMDMKIHYILDYILIRNH